MAALVGALRAAAPADAPLLVPIDQEGGLVQRLRAPADRVAADCSRSAAAGDAARTDAVGRALGAELAALGFGWDFAPVLDVHTNPANPVIGNRAFGTTPEAVARRRWRSGAGCARPGVLGCGKHFPGHGDTRDRFAPRAAGGRARPRAAARASSWRRSPRRRAPGMEAFMTAHVLYPGARSRRRRRCRAGSLTELLRGELGFRGVMVSDDLGMKAVADRYPHRRAGGPGHRGRLRSPARARAGRPPAGRVRGDRPRAAEARADFRARVEEAAARVAALKAAGRVEMPAPGAALPSLLGTPAHKALAGSFAPVAASAAEHSPVTDPQA